MLILNSTKLTLPAVNKALKAAGITDRLVRGNGYFYFTGKASTWPDNAVHVFNLDDLPVTQWVAEYRRLEREADPSIADAENERRYGRGRKTGK